jgi:hypothetical protein
VFAVASAGGRWKVAEWLMPVGVLAAWFVVARWVLPALGVPT